MHLVRSAIVFFRGLHEDTGQFAEHAALIKPIRQVYALLQTTDDLQRAIHLTGDDHVETVRTKVDRGEFLWSWGLIIYRHRLIGLLE